MSSRTERYDLYVGQVRCALTKVDELIEAMRSAGTFEDSIIIVHGDHGSRISQITPRLPNRGRMQRQDYYDGFSTLFAIKAPHIVPGYDVRMRPLERLLRHAENENSENLEPTEGNFVYLREAPRSSKIEKVPMPEIPNSLAPPRATNN